MNIDAKVSLIRGETKIWKFQRKDGSGNVITSMPDEIYCTIKANYDDNEVLLQKTYTGGDITYASEWWYVNLSATDTLSLMPGKYVIDVKVITDSGASYIVKPQTLSVRPCVTEDIE